MKSTAILLAALILVVGCAQKSETETEVHSDGAYTSTTVESTTVPTVDTAATAAATAATTEAVNDAAHATGTAMETAGQAIQEQTTTTKTDQ
jgi:PBP1b-binding outer membrane lipoprotein LpoB